MDPLPLPLEYGPSPRSLRMYGLTCVSATLVASWLFVSFAYILSSPVLISEVSLVYALALSPCIL